MEGSTAPLLLRAEGNDHQVQNSACNRGLKGDLTVVDYQSVIRRIQEQLRERGATESEVADAFGPASAEDLACLTDLYGTYSYWSTHYREEDLQELKGMRVPDRVLDFYRTCAPQWLPVLNGNIHLSALSAIRDENASGPPGMYLIKLGVVAFGGTTGGHSICMDLNRLTNGEPRVVLVDYTFCSFDEYRREIICTNMVPDKVDAEYRAAGKPFTLTYELFARCAPELSPTFSGFLDKLADRSWDDVEGLLEL